MARRAGGRDCALSTNPGSRATRCRRRRASVRVWPCACDAGKTPESAPSLLRARSRAARATGRAPGSVGKGGVRCRRPPLPPLLSSGTEQGGPPRSWKDRAVSRTPARPASRRSRPLVVERVQGRSVRRRRAWVRGCGGRSGASWRPRGIATALRPTSSASPAERCSTRSLTAPPTPRSSPTWPGAGCARRSGRSKKPWRAASTICSLCRSARSSRTWTSLMSRSPSSPKRSGSRSSRRPLSCCAQSRRSTAHR
jgi:hypothetical protein